MSDLVLWGAGGHGKVVLDVARAIGGFETISFIDSAFEGTDGKLCGCPVFGAARYLLSLKGRRFSQYLVSIGKNGMRAACFRGPSNMVFCLPHVHPSAVISDSARLEDGTVVMARVVINAEAQMGRIAF